MRGKLLLVGRWGGGTAHDELDFKFGVICNGFIVQDSQQVVGGFFTHIFGWDMHGGKRRLPLPLFVIGFCACVALNSAGVVPSMVLDGLGELSKWCLVSAIAGLGVKTSLKALFTIGYQPLVMILAETVFIALWILIGVQLIG